MGASLHVLINGLSIGEGGGLTVGRELLRHLAEARSAWQFTMAVTRGHPVHERLRDEALPPNCAFLWAPEQSSGHLARRRYERSTLRDWLDANAAKAVLQLNGMVIPRLGNRTLSHFQDPWPYAPHAWSQWRDPLLSVLKRRAHADALRQICCAGFTSAYLRDLICGRLGVRPPCAEVFYNGLPQDWIDAARQLPAWNTRPLEILSLSNVGPHKRQSLVIRALPLIIAQRPELRSLVYRIAGACNDPYRAELTRLAESLGVAGNVVFEGRVSDQRVPELYSCARCFVLMSVCESFGMPMLEAMCFGAPVVTSDCCAMPEVCGDAASISPADDVDALAKRIIEILTSPAHAEDLRARGSRRVQAFSWKNTAAKMAARLEEIGSS